MNDTFYVCEGWWNPNVKSGQVHDHPDKPGRGWSHASHRLCEKVYTLRTKHVPEPEWGIVAEEFRQWAHRGKALLDELEDMYA